VTIDRYTKAVLTVIAAALLVIALRPWLPDGGWSGALQPAPAQAQTEAAKYEVTLPRGWGRLVGFSNNNLLLEAPDRTLRVVDVEGKAPEYPRVKILVRQQP
jgi:hypothetical protein